MHLQEKCLLLKSPNCFAIYDTTFNLSHIEPDGAVEHYYSRLLAALIEQPVCVCLKLSVKLENDK